MSPQPLPRQRLGVFPSQLREEAPLPAPRQARPPPGIPCRAHCRGAKVLPSPQSPFQDSQIPPRDPQPPRARHYLPRPRAPRSPLRAPPRLAFKSHPPTLIGQPRTPGSHWPHPRTVIGSAGTPQQLLIGRSVDTFNFHWLLGAFPRPRLPLIGWQSEGGEAAEGAGARSALGVPGGAGALRWRRGSPVPGGHLCPGVTWLRGQPNLAPVWACKAVTPTEIQGQ